MPPAQWLIGSAICLVGAACINLGLNVQKLSHMRNEDKAHDEQHVYLKQPLWWLGFSVFLGGELLNFAALGFASQTLLAVLGSFSLVCNALTAPCLLGETLTRSDVLATVIIIGGGGLVAVYSDHKEQSYTLKELEAMYKSTGVTVFFALCGAILVGSMAAVAWVRRREQTPSTTRAMALVYVTLGSLMGAIGFLLAKSTAQLIRTSLSKGGTDQFQSLVSYAILGGFITSGVLRIHWINKALQVGHALLVVPSYFVMSTVLTIIGGLVYFREGSQFTVYSGSMFGVGVLCTLTGVFIIAYNEAVGGEEATELHTPLPDAGSAGNASAALLPVDVSDTILSTSEASGSPLMTYSPVSSPRSTSPAAPTVTVLPPPALFSRGRSLQQQRPFVLEPSTPSSLSVASDRSGRRYSYQPTAFTGSFIVPGGNRHPLLGVAARPPSRRVRRKFSVGVIGLGLS